VHVLWVLPLPISTEFRRRWVKSSVVVFLLRLSWHSFVALGVGAQVVVVVVAEKPTAVLLCTALFRQLGLAGFQVL